MKLNDWGQSSMTLLCVHVGIDMEEPCIPYDPSDFQRCYHLFQCLKFSRIDRDILLRKTAKKYSQWIPFAAHWSELTQIYEKEQLNETAPNLYEAMKALYQ